MALLGTRFGAPALAVGAALLTAVVLCVRLVRKRSCSWAFAEAVVALCGAGLLVPLGGSTAVASGEVRPLVLLVAEWHPVAQGLFCLMVLCAPAAVFLMARGRRQASRPPRARTGTGDRSGSCRRDAGGGLSGRRRLLRPGEALVRALCQRRATLVPSRVDRGRGCRGLDRAPGTTSSCVRRGACGRGRGRVRRRFSGVRCQPGEPLGRRRVDRPVPRGELAPVAAVLIAIQLCCAAAVFLGGRAGREVRPS